MVIEPIVNIESDMSYETIMVSNNKIKLDEVFTATDPSVIVTPDKIMVKKEQKPPFVPFLPITNGKELDRIKETLDLEFLALELETKKLNQGVYDDEFWHLVNKKGRWLVRYDTWKAHVEATRVPYDMLAPQDRFIIEHFNIRGSEFSRYGCLLQPQKQNKFIKLKNKFRVFVSNFLRREREIGEGEEIRMGGGVDSINVSDFKIVF